MKSASEARLRSEIRSQHSFLAFLVEHTSKLLSKYHVGRDGRKVYVPYRGQMVEFGEKVFLMLVHVGCSRHAALDAMRLDAAFKDIRDLSGDMLFGTFAGVVDKTNFWRRPESEHWDAEFLRTKAGRASC